MKAEIIAVGTELLLGQIVNTNAQYIAQQLALLGVDVYFQTVVGDNKMRLRSVLEAARERADIVLLTGGLGPTMDDLTKDVVAELFARSMSYHEPSMEKMERFFQERGVTMIESNRRQALLIEGADPLDNEAGLAVGNAMLVDDVAYIMLPGPPKEMKPMFELQVIPWLEKHVFAERSSLYSRMLKFAGIGESALEAELIDLIEQQADPTIAPYAKEGEVLIRLATKSADEDEAERKLNRLEEEIRSRVGQYIFATEDISLERAVVARMRELGLTLSAAESCTGGLFAQLVTSVPGSSQVFAGGVVAYSNELKQRALGVPPTLLEGESAPGAVSAETAAAMAEGVLALTEADLAVAITGVAGPDSQEGKPVGLVYIAIAERGHSVVTEQLRVNGNREMVRLRSAKAVLVRVWRRLNAIQAAR
ncbi:competence/damage-inducible protein A [Paenibacillus sp. 481]|uniref:competence/damage-inducible protein A n=1 Tax=Paenibacillus sp. 481 TaxID=2835869 RepID=UPI001E4860FB|nr:competence/damage-inducible protein A [Paenibacillus sp. 481]UHA75772.1 competence/damage-inducible protein A [Paenibacillus sp. 481]